jgi:hypothetical protein
MPTLRCRCRACLASPRAPLCWLMPNAANCSPFTRGSSPTAHQIPFLIRHCPTFRFVLFTGASADFTRRCPRPRGLSLTPAADSARCQRRAEILALPSRRRCKCRRRRLAISPVNRCPLIRFVHRFYPTRACSYHLAKPTSTWKTKSTHCQHCGCPCPQTVYAAL